ncbi:MAG: hypothetical protein LBE18_10030 [Planctomycetaceae bacterium]|jgi:acyl carrier protein|nr:hypothetical protein [Planctomycetaceae bacterium]
MTKQEFIQELEFVLNTEAGMLTEDTVLSSIAGWDSTGMLGVVAILDDAGITVPIVKLRNSTTVTELIKIAENAIE